MKFIIVFIISMFVSFTNANALIIDATSVYVGETDVLKTYTTLDNSGNGEITWLSSVLGSDFVVTDFIQTEFDDKRTESDPWQITDQEYTYAFDFGDVGPYSSYFLIKLGGGNAEALGLLGTHFLYDNGEIERFAVVSLWDFISASVDDEIPLMSIDIFRISHLGSAAPAPVPEPSTLLLLGSGLVGFAIYRRRNK